jgi:hypothetical protein
VATNIDTDSKLQAVILQHNYVCVTRINE